MQPEKLTHHHILLYDGDFDRLGDLYNTKKPTTVIRALVRKHIQAIETKLEKQDVR